MVRLSMKGVVKVPIYLSPRYVYLSGKKDQKMTKSVQVRAELERPLILTPVQFNLEDKVSYNIEEIVKERKYRIRFTTIPGQFASYRGFLRLKTNYPEKPELLINIRGRFN